MMFCYVVTLNFKDLPLAAVVSFMGHAIAGKLTGCEQDFAITEVRIEVYLQNTGTHMPNYKVPHPDTLPPQILMKPLSMHCFWLGCHLARLDLV